jgi:hypothetical protein
MMVSVGVLDEVPAQGDHPAEVIPPEKPLHMLAPLSKKAIIDIAS